VPLPRIYQLLARAKDGGVEAALVRVENFDEIMRDLVRLKADINTTVLDPFAVVRLNALPVTQTPSVCRPRCLFHWRIR